MIQFVAYSFWGFWLAWRGSNAFGYVDSSFTSYDYIAYIGSLLFLFIAGPLSLFLPRVSAFVALVGVAFMLSRLAGFVEYDFNNIFVCLLSMPIVGWPGFLAAYELWKTRREKWLQIRPWKIPLTRVIMAVLPSAIFVMAFDFYQWKIIGL